MQFVSKKQKHNKIIYSDYTTSLSDTERLCYCSLWKTSNDKTAGTRLEIVNLVVSVGCHYLSW